MIKLREQKKQMYRQRILEAASLQFERQGFSETSIADIMKTAGLGVGTFYNYFESKEEILLALLKSIANKVEQAVEKGIKAKIAMKIKIIF